MTRAPLHAAGIVAIANLLELPMPWLRPGCAKSLLHESPAFQAAMFRIAPGAGVPAHRHPATYDLFIGVSGRVEIRCEGASTCFELAAGSFCCIPPGTRHEVSNPGAEEGHFLLIHAPYEDFGFQTEP